MGLILGLKLQTLIPVLIKFFGGLNIAEAITGDIQMAALFVKIFHLKTGHPFFFRGGDPEGVAPHVQTEFTFEGVVKRKLIRQVNVRADRITIGHQIFARAYIMNR